MFGLFNKKQTRCLGIDFGASGIKIAELTKADKSRLVLSNYIIGQAEAGSRFSLAKLDADAIAKILKDLLQKAGIKASGAVVSLSVGETFSTVIDLPFMPEADLAKAIPYEALKYVPGPIGEVALAWSVVGRPAAEVASSIADIALSSDKSVPRGQGAMSVRDSNSTPGNFGSGAGSKGQSPQGTGSSTSGKAGSGTLQVLIVAVPKELVGKIAQVAKKTDLKILAIEQEAFSAVRSLIGRDEAVFLIIDLGQENADFILVDKNSIRLIFTFELAKKPDLIAEAQRIINLCQTRYSKKPAKIILTGGRVSRLSQPSPDNKENQPDWPALFKEKLSIVSGLGDPFARLTYDQKLAPVLKEISPFMAVAIGAAMREL